MQRFLETTKQSPSATQRYFLKRSNLAKCRRVVWDRRDIQRRRNTAVVHVAANQGCGEPHKRPSDQWSASAQQDLRPLPQIFRATQQGG